MVNQPVEGSQSEEIYLQEDTTMDDQNPTSRDIVSTNTKDSLKEKQLVVAEAAVRKQKMLRIHVRIESGTEKRAHYLPAKHNQK